MKVPSEDPLLEEVKVPSEEDPLLEEVKTPEELERPTIWDSLLEEKPPSEDPS